jgi:hypothetical protein
LINQGSATWSTGDIFQASDAVFRNAMGASLDLTGDVSQFTNGGANNLFDNQGSTVKSGGTGTSRIGVPANNSGNIHVQTGTLNVTGSFTQTSAGSLTSDVAGTAAANIGRITAAAVTLDGEFEVNITGGYTPTLGDMFSPLTYTSRAGTFAMLTGTALGGGLVLQESYGANALGFEVVAE